MMMKLKIWMDPYGNRKRFGQSNKAYWSLRQDRFYRNLRSYFWRKWQSVITPGNTLKGTPNSEGGYCAGKLLFVWAKFGEPLNLSSLSWLTSAPASPTISGICDPFCAHRVIICLTHGPCQLMQKKDKEGKKRKRGRWNTCDLSINRTDHDYIVLRRN